MDVTTLTTYFLQYGSVFIFAIVLLEYMNLPGFPAGIIMPLSGIWAAKGDISFMQVLFLSVAAGLIGSWLLYFLGRFGGESFFRFYTKKFPEQKETIEKYLGVLREKGSYGVFVSKLLPMIRTLISIPAGMVSMNFWKYTVSSAAGVFLWNIVFVGAGYYFGDAVWNMLV